MIVELKQSRVFAAPAFFRAQLNRFGPLLGLVLVVVVFSILTGAPERYLAPKNLRTVLVQTVIVAIGAIGMTMIIISGGIDLSVGSAIAWHSGRRPGRSSQRFGNHALTSRALYRDSRNAGGCAWSGQGGCGFPDSDHAGDMGQ